MGADASHSTMRSLRRSTSARRETGSLCHAVSSRTRHHRGPALLESQLVTFGVEEVHVVHVEHHLHSISHAGLRSRIHPAHEGGLAGNHIEEDLATHTLADLDAAL